MKRREALRLLAAAGAALAHARAGFGIGDKSRITLGRLAYPGDKPLARPGALERLAWELSLRTSVVPSFNVLASAAEDPRLFETPFLYMWGDAAFAPFTDAAVLALRRHLELGGLLLADDGSGSLQSGFEASVRREAVRLFPTAPLARLPEDHSIFRSYYLLRRLGGRVLVSPFLEACTLADRSPLVLCKNDLGGAWARDAAGRFLYECAPGGEPQRQQALFVGVNAVLYALTVNYKQDQIHLPFILQRMRR